MSALRFLVNLQSTSVSNPALATLKNAMVMVHNQLETKDFLLIAAVKVKLAFDFHQTWPQKVWIFMSILQE